MLEEILPIFLMLSIFMIVIGMIIVLSTPKLEDYKKENKPLKGIFSFLFKLKNWKLEAREQNDKEDLR